MKGLLLKDIYMTAKYYRSYLLIAIAFAAVSFVSAENIFFVFYPCLIGGMIPANLLAYDESNRWLLYSCTLPITRRQFVSAKYLIGLFAQLLMLLLVAAAQAARMVRAGSFQWMGFLTLMMLTIILSTVSSSISLPFMFRNGVEKGRVVYYIVIGAVCAGAVIASKLLPELQHSNVTANSLIVWLCLGGIAIYVLSWLLSIRFYEKRELG